MFITRYWKKVCNSTLTSHAFRQKVQSGAKKVYFMIICCHHQFKCKSSLVHNVVESKDFVDKYDQISLGAFNRHVLVFFSNVTNNVYSFH